MEPSRSFGGLLIGCIKLAIVNDEYFYKYDLNEIMIQVRKILSKYLQSPIVNEIPTQVIDDHNNISNKVKFATQLNMK